MEFLFGDSLSRFADIWEWEKFFSLFWLLTPAYWLLTSDR